MSFFKRLLSSSTGKIINADLIRLNNVQSELGNKAVDYVLSGEPATVLSTLGVHASGDPLLLCTPGHYYAQTGQGQHKKRAPLFLDLDPYDIPMLVRYAEVLAATANPLPDRVVGSDKAPTALRVFFSEAFTASMASRHVWPPEPRKEAPKGLTPDRFADVAKACGGTLEDVFEVLYWISQSYYEPIKGEYLRQLCDIAPLIEAHPDAAIAGVRRCTAGGREAFINELALYELADKGPFLEFLLELAGDSSKAVREAAVKALGLATPEVIEPKAVDLLATGKVGVRAGMVDVLVKIGSPTAREALEAHAKTEKTARIVSAIENALSVATAAAGASGGAPDDATGYTAIDGTRVEIPPLRPLKTGELVTLGPDDIAELEGVLKKENKRIDERNAANKDRKFFYKQPHLSPSFVKLACKLIEGKALSDDKGRGAIYFLTTFGHQVAQRHLSKMSEKQAISLAFNSLYSIEHWLSGYNHGPFADLLRSYVGKPESDLRAIDALWEEMGAHLTIGGWRNRQTRKAKRGDVLRCLIPDESYLGSEVDDIAPEALWPYLAENLDVLGCGFGQGDAEQDVVLDKPRAIKCLGKMPKVPMRFFGPLLDVATGERKFGKAEARKLLADVPEVDGRLIALLDDSRQAIRAGAAEWIGQRGQSDAIPALKKRLKKEKSELAKAAILTAMKELGVPLDDYVGPTALIREAEAGLKKANLSKLDWINLDTLPKLKFRAGKAVPPDVPRWWMFLGFKLKQPGGNALFEIFLDQLAPDSAETLSQWVLDSWVNYDTTTASDEEANAYAEANAQQRYAMYKRYYPEYTLEQCKADLRREIKSNYVNSGAAAKGILAFASRAPATIAADRVRGYLRNHGSRTSQASSLLDVLANKGDPVSLQVVIAAATRLKQKGVQAYAGELVQTVADRMGWSMDELGDRVIPSAGLDDEGHLDLPCGPDEKPYRATLSEDLTFVLQNPDGKVIKGLPAGDDDATKTSKKQLTASKKELKQVVSMQSGRLYEALCAARSWSLEAWMRDFHGHPVMRRMIERIVWQGVDAEGQPLGTFRPTAEGEFTDAEDTEVDLEQFDAIRVAHGAMLDEATTEAWAQHLKDYEVKPLFIQFGRSLMRLDEEERDATKIEDRKGWVMETFQLRGLTTKLGWERGPAEDGGWFHEYRKPFTSAGVTAVVDFTGNILPEENQPCALISLGFVKAGVRMHQPIKLGDVPEVLLSECWNDFHAMAEKGAHDPEWEKKCAW
ncbi:MAG: DUF4132 domain-containing protein [Pseudomonadota bacterium]